MHDLAIVGGGPAGISAALEAARLGLSAVLFEPKKLGGQMRAANRIEDYPPLVNISGIEIASAFAEHFEQCGIPKISDRILKIARNKDGFVITGEKDAYNAASVFVATGQEPVKIDFPADIHYYPVPHDVPHEGRDVLIIGGGDAAFDEALTFAHRARSVTVAVRGGVRARKALVRAADERHIPVLNISEVSKNDYSVFVACAGKIPDIGLLLPLFPKGLPDKVLKLGKLCDGVYCGGDLCRGASRHIALAVADGVNAALGAHEYLAKKGAIL